MEITSLDSLRENQGIGNMLLKRVIEGTRKLKPEIPLNGENSISLMHKIEFEMIL